MSTIPRNWPATLEMSVVHIVIDIETLGLDTDAVIESIGIVEVERNAIVRRYHWFVDLDQPGRAKNQATMEWRQKHSPIQDVPRGDLLCCLKDMHNIINAWTDLYMVWSWRNFDFRLLTHAYEQYKMPTPWKYNQCYDIPSYMLGAGISMDKSPNTTHIAVEDAENEAKVLIAHWQSKGITL